MNLEPGMPPLESPQPKAIPGLDELQEPQNQEALDARHLDPGEGACRPGARLSFRSQGRSGPRASGR